MKQAFSKYLSKVCSPVRNEEEKKLKHDDDIEREDQGLMP
jgi:hypothetical protein